MRHYRQNADTRARDLERRYAGGDAAAGFELVRVLYRDGQLTLQRALALGDMVPSALASIDPALSEQLGFLFAAPVLPKPATPGDPDSPGLRGAIARAAVGRQPENWFPGWSRVTTCPRGHRIGDPHVDWSEFELEWATRHVAGVTGEGMLLIEGGRDSQDGVGGSFLECATRIGPPGPDGVPVPIPGQYQGGPEGFGPTCSAVWRPDTALIEYV